MGTEMKADVVNMNFVEFVQEINKGMSAAELSAAMESVVQSVKDTGLKGELVYKIVVKPVGASQGGDVEQVTVVDTITKKCPQHKRRECLFFTTGRNTLTRNNPNQGDFFEEAQK